MSEKRKRNCSNDNDGDNTEENMDDNVPPELIMDERKQRKRLSDHLVTQYLEAIQQNNTLMKTFMEVMEKTNTLLENLPTTLVAMNNGVQHTATSRSSNNAIVNHNDNGFSNEEIEYIRQQKRDDPIPDPQTMEFTSIEEEKENPKYEELDRERPYNDKCTGCNGECVVRIVNKKSFARYGIPYSECPIPMKDREGLCLKYGKNGKKWYYDTKEKYRVDAMPTEDQLILLRPRRPRYYEAIMRYCKQEKIGIVRTTTGT
jgi:hypothetical protein